MIEVIRPGTFTTIQDLGREGHGHLGVSAAGAADAFNLRIANRLVSNPDTAAALEMTAEGVTLKFERDVSIALSGGALEASLDGEPLPMHQTLAVKAGAELSCGRITHGWRSYLAVAGGIEAPLLLGSRSSDTLAGLGSGALSAGARLTAGKTDAQGMGAYLRSPTVYGSHVTVRVIAGPQQDWFTAAAFQSLHDGAYRVLPKSDRTGVRLEGESLPRLHEGELPPQGMVTGAVQVPGSGQPIVLLPNHGATGGYPVIATVISADLHLLAQLAPGASVRFKEVSRAEALTALREQQLRLAQDIVPADAGLLAARALMVLAGHHTTLRQAAVSDGHRRIRIRK